MTIIKKYKVILIIYLDFQRYFCSYKRMHTSYISDIIGSFVLLNKFLSKETKLGQACLKCNI